jgi:hypothetical protein
MRPPLSTLDLGPQLFVRSRRMAAIPTESLHVQAGIFGRWGWGRFGPFTVLALQDRMTRYTPSTHTSLESPCNGGINGYFTCEHGLLQGEPSIITSEWG